MQTTASIFEALASDSNTPDGLNSHAVIINELHTIKGRNLYEVMKQSTSSRRQPLVVMITTAGTVRESVFNGIYRFACEISDGDKKGDTFLPVLYELDSRDEWTDPAKWEKANPGLGTIKQYKPLATFVEQAKIKPEDLLGVLCKDFNVRKVSADIWLSFDSIQSDLRFEIWKIDAIKIGYDCALAKYWVDEMTVNGFDMEVVAHGLYTWSQPMREMGAALETKQANYNGNPILLWCLTNNREEIRLK